MAALLAALEFLVVRAESQAALLVVEERAAEPLVEDWLAAQGAAEQAVAFLAVGLADCRAERQGHPCQ